MESAGHGHVRQGSGQWLCLVVIGKREIMEAANYIHQQYLLDGADRPWLPEESRSDGKTSHGSTPTGLNIQRNGSNGR